MNIQLAPGTRVAAFKWWWGWRASIMIFMIDHSPFSQIFFSSRWIKVAHKQSTTGRNIFLEHIQTLTKC